MNHLKRFSKYITNLAFLSIFLPGILTLATYIIAREIFGAPTFVAGLAALALFFGLAVWASGYIARASLTPLEKTWQAIWHVSPGKENVPAPKLEGLKHGHELVSSMVRQVYDLASKSAGVPTGTQASPHIPVTDPGKLIEQLPLAIFVLNKDQHIVSCNNAAKTYLSLPAEKIIGKFAYDVLRLSFTNEDTLENWLATAKKSKATDTHTWEHVRAVIEDKKEIKQFDLAASFSRDDPAGNEVVLAIFDRSAHYDRQDQASSYVTMAVHELRTPLTLLRGYIEVFEDELGTTLSTEHQEFMRKMQAAAQSLTAFVSNILNVARIDENQMTLSLHEGNWNEVLTSIVKDLELRANVRGKTLELAIEPDLPSVAIDRISMYEVVSNLVDNAVKYSGQSKRVVISSKKSSDNAVETIVEDFGPGMPESTVSQLFTKFYRSHRSRGFVGGSGLGLYLVRAIVTAHGGHVWVNSTEGEGSKFGFTLQTFDSISTDNQAPDGIERQASGWIKNHSMYRR